MSVDVESAALTQIADAVARGQCLLFLGAGVHAEPPESSPYVYSEADRPPLGSTLSELLAKECDLVASYPNENTKNLQRTSLFYETMRSRRQLVQEIEAVVQAGKKPSPVLRGLAELGFTLLITTNYDQLLERALRDAGRDPRVTVYSPDSTRPTEQNLDDPTAGRPFVFKIHGDIGTPESVVITDEDYIQFVLRMRDQKPYYPVPEIFRFQLERWTTLFVGYSLVDYNLRLLFKTLRWGVDRANIPDAYSVDCHPDPLVVEVFENQQKYLKFIVQDSWTFVPALYHAVTGKEMPDYRD
jgi:SIR2-like domain